MNELQQFEFNKYKVRAILLNDEPYFVGKDIAEVLGYKNASKALNDHVDEEDKLNNVSLSSLGQRGGWLVNESGLYSLILSSKLPQARMFKRWVTSDVLPQIRKTGSYSLQKDSYMIEDPIERAKRWIEEQEERKALENENKAMKPKARFAEAVSASEESILIGQLAKIIKQNGVDIGQNRLFQWMRDNDYLIKNGTRYNQPTQKAMELGLFEVKERTVNNPDGSVRITFTTKVTGKGQVYFVNKFLNA